MATTLTETEDPVQRQEGMEILRSLVLKEYEPVKVHFALAMLETDNKQFESAVQHYRAVLQLFEKATVLAPTNVQAKHNLCVALADDGQLEASEKCLLSAIDLAPAEQYLHEHLAIVRKRMSLT
ncbi:unnamed protein product [Echinostoma caproni]|uniref:TPR_REGION domain-containing protein n=1 Tax=Echinostoma caproni TaxID=27848 RepID=A0A183B9Z3_9TREM|nr:unnamed protein product [Echinostoma caproni]